MKRSVYVGFDSREGEAYEVCVSSMRRRLSRPVQIHAIVLDDLVQRGLYSRPTKRRDGKLYDLISKTDDYDGRMATEFAISRFLTPHLAREGLAMFCDCDFLWRCDVNEIFDQVDLDRAVSCVQHGRYQSSAEDKMDGVPQSAYAFKNWSSMMVFNCNHPANKALTLDLINFVPGRELHAFCWLQGSIHQVGSLPSAYNHLVGEVEHDPDAKGVHFTLGGPWFPGFEDAPFADEWRAERSRAPGAVA